MQFLFALRIDNTAIITMIVAKLFCLYILSKWIEQSKVIIKCDNECLCNKDEKICMKELEDAMMYSQNCEDVSDMKDQLITNCKYKLK